MAKRRTTAFNTPIAYDENDKPLLPKEERLAAYVLARVKGAIEAVDAKLYTGAYERDRALAEGRIERAKTALKMAGGHGSKESRTFDLGWAHHELEEALVALAMLVARYQLAARWKELGIDQMEKSGEVEAE